MAFLVVDKKNIILEQDMDEDFVVKKQKRKHR